jgi:hypothetical protein
MPFAGDYSGQETKHPPLSPRAFRRASRAIPAVVKKSCRTSWSWPGPIAPKPSPSSCRSPVTPVPPPLRVLPLRTPFFDRGWGKATQPIDVNVQSDIAKLIEEGGKRARGHVPLSLVETEKPAAA